MSDAIVRLFVLFGFLFLALNMIPVWDRRTNGFHWTAGLAALSFAVALVLHIVGMIHG